MAKCGKCKVTGDSVTVAQIKACYAGDPNAHASIQVLKEEPAEAVRQEPGRVYINVPYREKNEAKEKIGARWDPDKRSWWVPTGTKVPRRWASAESVAEKVQASRSPRSEPEIGFYRVSRENGVDDFFMVYKTVHGMNPGQIVSKILSVVDYVDDVPTHGVWRYQAKRFNDVIVNRGVKLTLDEAKSFGKIYGFCIRCGRTLTDENSKAAGIGPICAGKWS